MRIVSADSGAAILDEEFQPLQIVACTAVLVDYPYREALKSIGEPIFVDAEKGYELVVHELKLCQKLLKTEKANVVHLDISLGAMPINEITAAELSNMKVYGKARTHILKILPKLRKIAADINRIYNINVLAIGKESIPVRIAELTAGAYAIIFSAKKALEEKRGLTIGLPSKCQPKKVADGIIVHSLMPAEHDIYGYAKDEEKLLEKIKIVEMLNPYARGFRAVQIVPKE